MAKGSKAMGYRPEGIHSITPQITVRDGAAAIELYKRALGAVEVGRFLMPGSNKIMHASFRVGDSAIFLNDEMPQMGAVAPKDGVGGSRFYLYVEDVDAQHKKALAVGMTERSAPSDMFWGDRTSVLADRFGQNWTLAAHKRDVSEAEMKKAAAAMMQK
jgi:PhnB protein